MEVKEQAEGHVLRPEGDLTIFEAAEFREALLALIKHDGSCELDVSDVERVDSSGIQLLVAASQHGSLGITGMTSAIREKIIGVGCEQLVTIQDK
ncbi:STAS domain-containing protein [Nitrospira sp. M1]